MGNSVNKKAGVEVNGDYRKKIMVHLGLFQNLAGIHYKNLAGADQYELDRAFDALSEEQVKTALDEINAPKTS